MSTVLFDIETNGLMEELDRVHCIVLREDDGPYQRFGPTNAPIEEALEILAGADRIVGHNIMCFDVPALQKVYPEFQPRGKIVDTLVLSRLIWSDLKNNDFKYVRSNAEFPKKMIGRHGLEAWGFRLGVLKGDYGKTTDWSKWTPEMTEYCEQDVVVLGSFMDLIDSKSYSPKAVTLEHRFQEVIRRQQDFGFAFDVEAARDLYGTLCLRRMELKVKLQEVFLPRVITMKTPDHWRLTYVGAETSDDEDTVHATKTDANAYRKEKGWKPKHCVIEPGPLKVREIPFNPGSTDQIADRLMVRYGWDPQAFTDGGKPQVTETILKALEFPEAAMLAEYQTIEKRIGQIAEGSQAWLKVERGGRIYGQVNTNGAHTGRCSHHHPNVAQVPRVGNPYGKECRSLFIADPGYSLVGCDASGLELRCFAHYLARYDGGRYVEIVLEGDPHAENQKAAGIGTRELAKVAFYAWLYGASDGKIGSIVGKGPAAGRQIRESLLSKTPGLATLIEAVHDAAMQKGFLIGLDGRQVPIRSKHASFNTLLQGAGALIMKQATVCLDDALFGMGLEWGKDFANVAHIHDEFQLQVRSGLEETVGTQAVKAIERAGEIFDFRCPVTGGWKSGKNWAETH